MLKRNRSWFSSLPCPQRYPTWLPLRAALLAAIRSSTLQSVCLAIACLTATSEVLGDQRGAAPPSTAAEIYGQGVRETAKRSPAEEQAGFHVPTGFAVELIAAEPQIAKPMNMAFDRQGRLWVTDTLEYPYPVAGEATGRDSIKVLSDQDHNGTFETVSTFASGLNIPIGILPLEDGVLCFSIPNLMLLRDRDGDGRCDEQKIILGPFDTSRDTHGMVNALRQGNDGWIYACHGFNNQSHVTAADGSQIHLFSGNTFRFRPDGSHVEQFTSGQVNPFGMTSDQWGNWYTADCHSKPVTLLVPGGCYESFGRPHDGLGFVPSLMKHLHGSTAICGIHFYQADHFPTDYRFKFYSGNVMTSRINCNRLEVRRDAIQLVEEPDFMTSDDPWFRPVDVQLGPDGALYVADFYNKIIGHYEVRLDHPERDRTSGRIWRIAYRAQPQQNQPEAVSRSNQPLPTTYPLLSPVHLQELAHSNTTRRQFALDRFAGITLTTTQIEQLQNLVAADANDVLRASAVWALHRTGADTPTVLATLAEKTTSSLVLDAIFKAWEDRPTSTSPSVPLLNAASAALSSDQPQLVISAAQALAKHGGAAELSAILDQCQRRASEPGVALHALRIALKRMLQRNDVFDSALASWKNEPPQQRAASAINCDTPQATWLADILPSVDSPRAAEALMHYVTQQPQASAAQRDAAVRLACKHMTPDLADPMMTLLKQVEGTEDVHLLTAPIDQQMALAIDALNTLHAAKFSIPQSLQALLDQQTSRLAQGLMAELTSPSAIKPISWRETRGKAWQLQERATQDAPKQKQKFYSSHTLGEAYTGTWSSATFPSPEKLRFYIVGHDGPPNMPRGGQTGVRLIAADTGQVLKTAETPRSDVAIAIDWDLSPWANQAVRLECYDRDAGSAYAWLGVGLFSLAQLNPSPIEGAVSKLSRFVEAQPSDSIEPLLESVLHQSNLGDGPRSRLIAALATRRGLGLVRFLADAAELRGQSQLVQPPLLAVDPAQASVACHDLAATLTVQLPQSQQVLLARGMLATLEGRQLLVQLIDEGRIAPHSLRGLSDLLGSTNPDSSSQRLIELSALANAANSEAEKDIQRRIAGIQLAGADRERGRAVFDKNCAACHKLRGIGQLVGPQLDGIGVRGAQRLSEDVLLPNLNVDKAFRMTSLLMDDDRVLSGLVRESAGGPLELVGTDGKSQIVDRQGIVTRRETTRSLMPDNFADLLTDQDLQSLLDYLINP